MAINIKILLTECHVGGRRFLRNVGIIYWTTWLHIPEVISLHTPNVKYVLNGKISQILVTRLWLKKSASQWNLPMSATFRPVSKLSV
jgi:hypothetical protein